MDIIAYLQQQRESIQQEFNDLNQQYADMEHELMVMRVKLEHLRGAYQKIEEMEKELE